MSGFGRTFFKQFLGNNQPALSHDDALGRMAARGLDIRTVIDVGAAKGAWSEKAWRFWPGANAHLLEAKEAWRDALTAFQRRYNNVSFEIAGVGKAPGTGYFPKGGDEYGGAVFLTQDLSNSFQEIRLTSIDHEVSRLGLPGPFAIKLDTHGTEVDILDGATKTLEETALLCVETYNLFGQKRFPGMILDIEKRGFHCADLAEPLFRPYDNLLWQVDFYFTRADHPALENTQYLP